MSREETKNIIRVIVNSYPNLKPTNIAEMLDVWSLMLSDYDYKLVSIALKSYIVSDSSGFPPSIGQLVSYVNKFTKPEELNEMQAWSLVSKALRNGYYGAEEEFAKLPPLVQEAVGSVSQLRQWSITDAGSIENVVQSNFIRTYRTVVKRNEEKAKMPKEALRIAEKVAESSYKAILEQKQYNSISSSTNVIKSLESKNSRSEEYIPMPESAKEKVKELFK